jgi:hypothetical protein
MSNSASANSTAMNCQKAATYDGFTMLHLYHTNSLGYFACKLDALCCFIKLEIWYSVLKISNDKLLILNFTSTTHRNIKRIKE